MSTDAVAAIGFVALFALMMLRVPVGIAMGVVGVLGFGYMIGDIGPALKLLAQSPIRTATDAEFAVGVDYHRRDAFYRFNQTFQDYFDQTAKMETTFAV